MGLFSLLSPKKASKPRPRPRGKTVNFFTRFRKDREQAAMPGGFQGGKVDRITEEWRPGTIGPNRMVQMDGKLLRERAWDLFNNNPFAASAVNAYIANVIECGLFPERSDEWEQAWERWGGLTVHSTRECDLSRDETICGLQRTWLTEVIVGGGCLAHYVTVDRRSQSVPLAIELIGEDRFAQHLQHWGSNPKTANPIYNGIEVEESTGRTLAYHVLANQPNDLNNDPLSTIRLPAEHCEYGYFKGRTGAKRGTTLLRASIVWLWALGYYTDNELKNSDVKSTWAYMIKTSDTAELDWADLSDSDPETGTTDVYGNKIDKLEGQQIFRGFPGDEIAAVGPNVPGGDSLPWILMIQRSIAVGMNLSYEEMFRDFTKGSWSSVRSAMASDRKRFRPMQQFAIHHFGNPTVQRFDDTAVRYLVNGFPSSQQWVNARDSVWEAMDWSTPGWESPNPKDDATADDIRLANGTATYRDIMGRRGKSWRKHFRQRMVEMDTPGYPEPRQQPSAIAQPDPTEPEPIDGDEDE